MTNEERKALIAQGWTPPKVISLDEKWAHACTKELFDPLETVDVYRAYDYFLEAIKKGRELERAEAKPGLVWVKHDGSADCPVALSASVICRYASSATQTLILSQGNCRDWLNVTHYAIITPPEDMA